jgi:hypothetical protein
MPDTRAEDTRRGSDTSARDVAGSSRGIDESALQYLDGFVLRYSILSLDSANRQARDLPIELSRVRCVVATRIRGEEVFREGG